VPSLFLFLSRPNPATWRRRLNSVRMAIRPSGLCCAQSFKAVGARPFYAVIAQAQLMVCVIAAR
jgi:hypothetical protein